MDSSDVLRAMRVIVQSIRSEYEQEQEEADPIPAPLVEAAATYVEAAGRMLGAMIRDDPALITAPGYSQFIEAVAVLPTYVKVLGSERLRAGAEIREMRRAYKELVRQLQENTVELERQREQDTQNEGKHGNT